MVVVAGNNNRGFYLGHNSQLISHLHFVDDMLFFQSGVGSTQNIKAILLCFKVVFGLKINFFKSELIRVRVAENHLVALVPLCLGVASKSQWSLFLER